MLEICPETCKLLGVCQLESAIEATVNTPKDTEEILQRLGAIQNNKGFAKCLLLLGESIDDKIREQKAILVKITPEEEADLERAS